MPSVQEYRKAEEMLDLQEKYLSEQMKRHEMEISGLKATRRRRIVQRSFALFAGALLALFGIIDLVVIQSLDTHFINILIFTLSELIAIPFLRYGLVLFRKMPIEQEISAVVEELVHTQESIAQLRDERLRLIRTPVKETRANLSAPQTGEPLVRFDRPITTEGSGRCPECGEMIRAGAKICRTCGHLFI